MDFVPPKDGIFLSTMPVGPGQRRLALAVVAVATVLFLASAPFAKIQLERGRFHTGLRNRPHHL